MHATTLTTSDVHRMIYERIGDMAPENLVELYNGNCAEPYTALVYDAADDKFWVTNLNVRVEYDPEYVGDYEYRGEPKILLVSWKMVDAIQLEFSTIADIETGHKISRAFQALTGLDPSCIVHFNSHLSYDDHNNLIH